ncbi:hypothetical protein [Roseivirga sp.]|uniref:hypothetical protein n=1 Tax=Roseivirga sp. TaxID=1964215 RepID=UPI003B8CFD1C
MTDEEFDVLDELYFVQPFTFLLEELSMSAEEIKPVLKLLLDKGWVKCLRDMNNEVFDEDLKFEENYQNYFYLASKKGLLAHNGR